MPSGIEISNMLLSAARTKADIILSTASMERQIFEARAAERRQQIQQELAIREEKKAARKARKKKNATLAAVVIASIVTGGAAGVALGAAGAGAAVTGVASVGGGLAGAFVPIVTGASTASLFATGALTGLGTTFGLSSLTR